MTQAKKVRKALERAGNVVVRISGSHHMMRTVRTGRMIPFAYHDGDDLGPRQLAEIAKQFGYTLDELRKMI